MITVRVDDPAFFACDALARPATAELGATTSLMRRLEAAGGEALRRQLQVQEPLAVGSAVVTSAGELGVELLIHAVISGDSEPVSRGTVQRATRSALQRATDWRIGHLGFAPFGLGAGNLAIEESAAVMIEVIAQHLQRSRHPSAVTILVETEAEAEAFLACLPRTVA